MILYDLMYDDTLVASYELYGEAQQQYWIWADVLKDVKLRIEVREVIGYT